MYVARSMPPISAKASAGQAAITRSASGKRSAVANCERGSHTKGRHPAALARRHSAAA